MTQLLGSKNATDVIESLQFLTSAFEFGLKGAPEAVNKSLVLVWSPESSVREALVMMYKKLFLRLTYYMLQNFHGFYQTESFTSKNVFPHGRSPEYLPYTSNILPLKTFVEL